MKEPTSTAVQRICIDEHEVTELAAALVRIPTVPSLYAPGESAAVSLLAQLLDEEAISYAIHEVAPGRSNLVVEMGDGRGPTLWLNGHLDTVPIGSRLTWRFEPFGGDLVDARVYGRGASDCKGGVASMMSAALALSRAGVRLHGTLRLSAVIGEEEGQIGITHLLDRGLTADAFVSTQWSTASQIALGYRGLCWMEVTVYGRSAHGSRPAHGINAIEHMLDFVLPALRNLSLPGPADAVVDGFTPSVNLGRLDGGEAVNLVPDECRATLDYRLVSGQRSSDVVAAVDATLRRLQREHPTLSVEYQVLLQAEPFLTDPSSPLVRSLSRAVQAVCGCEPRLFGKSGTSDANLVHQRLGIPVVAYGPGNESGHGPDEYVAAADLAQVAEVYAALATDYLSARRNGGGA